ncbi:RIIB lysis inhibitor [Aeromonas phage Aes012]|uniref:Protector from prophage-induced early lysis n=1 Tax=Aeromonas phage Aes012 TaxID=1198014 RepID=I6ZIF7_9CAUD|nr:RIIB lysis inhibitor [Aeromonas phage Aes012]AFN69873.1 protector from prophage-induced early lysis [Aeromonas phage Aes012]
MAKLKIVKCFDNETKQQIFDKYASGNVSQAYLASEYRVSVDTIARVLKEVRNWDISAATPEDSPADEEIADKLECTWMANSKFLSVTIGSETYNASGDHPQFMEIIGLLREEKYDEAMEMLNIKRGLERYISGDLIIEGGTLKYKDLIIDSGLTRRIVEKMQNGEPFEPLVAFFENLMANPSRRAVYQLYDFLEHNDIEITDDGHFIAWKRVNSNFKDMYTGKFDNSPGTVVKVNRFQVDENPNVTCSHGLHVAAKSYIPHYGSGSGKVIACKVNPADVVAIPTDYNNAKMRCAGYEVLYEVTSDFKEMKHY